MSTAPQLPSNWGPAPNGRSAHSLLAPLYDYADVTDERLDELESRSGISVTRLRESVATSTALPATGNTTGDTRITEDTGRFWVWDGTGWVDTGTVAQVPGVTDHGALAGLEQDDHPQYLTQVRGDARYVQPSGLPTTPTWDTLAGRPAVIAAGTSQTVARNAIGAGTSNLQLGTGPTTAAAGDHGHTLNETTDTATRVAMTPTERTKLGGVATGATANSTDAALRARSSHTGTQAISTVNGLQGALDGKAEAGHTHDDRYYTETEVNTALEGKANTTHQHTAAQISDATTTGRAVMQASSASAARTAIGAGTSNLSLGTTSSTAARGNHTHDDRYTRHVVLDPGDPVPPGTPEGTLILRRAT